MPVKKKPPSSDDTSACGNCKGVKLKIPSCARCGLVKYFDKECQSAHWKVHKPNCTPKAGRAPQPNDGSRGHQACLLPW